MKEAGICFGRLLHDRGIEGKNKEKIKEGQMMETKGGK